MPHGGTVVCTEPTWGPRAIKQKLTRPLPRGNCRTVILPRIHFPAAFGQTLQTISS